MRIKVIHYENYFLRIRIHDICKIFDFFCPILGSTVFTYTNVSPGRIGSG